MEIILLIFIGILIWSALIIPPYMEIKKEKENAKRFRELNSSAPKQNKENCHVENKKSNKNNEQIVFKARIAGVSHNNIDGTSRQDLIKQIPNGCYLSIVPDPGNEFDKNAIKVMFNQDALGYIPKDKSRIIIEKINCNNVYQGRLVSKKSVDAGYVGGIIEVYTNVVTGSVEDFIINDKKEERDSSLTSNLDGNSNHSFDAFEKVKDSNRIIKFSLDKNGTFSVVDFRFEKNASTQVIAMFLPAINEVRFCNKSDWLNHDFFESYSSLPVYLKKLVDGMGYDENVIDLLISKTRLQGYTSPEVRKQSKYSSSSYCYEEEQYIPDGYIEDPNEGSPY